MSLRHQINLRIFFLSVCVLLIGGSIAVWQARLAVNQEINSSIQLAVQLIRFGFAHSEQTPDWLTQLNALEEIRHLTIRLQQPSGQILSVQHSKQHLDNKPPQWFISLVQGDEVKIEHVLTRADGQQLWLKISANPLDEISEVWQENIAFSGLLFILMLLSYVAVNLVFNKTLTPITTIVHALRGLETEHYQQLPSFAIQEFDEIALAINQLTDKLKQVKQENRALTQHTLAIQEDERQRLAQELHDELGQSLTAIKVMAVTAARTPDHSKQSTDAIIQTCDHLMMVVRSMMHQLHPLMLTELGLKATLEDLVQHWSNSLTIGLECDDSTDSLDSLDTKIAIQVFRVVQECLTNTVRHANASQVWIKISLDNKLSLTVLDNGQGCDTTSTTGFGLRGMKERINSLGGELQLLSEPHQGMKITASIPL
jgi:two-component system sensor histidine kinase UhpB